MAPPGRREKPARSLLLDADDLPIALGFDGARGTTIIGFSCSSCTAPPRSVGEGISEEACYRRVQGCKDDPTLNPMKPANVRHHQCSRRTSADGQGDRARPSAPNRSPVGWAQTRGLSVRRARGRRPPPTPRRGHAEGQQASEQRARARQRSPSVGAAGVGFAFSARRALVADAIAGGSASSAGVHDDVELGPQGADTLVEMTVVIDELPIAEQGAVRLGTGNLAPALHIRSTLRKSLRLAVDLAVDVCLGLAAPFTARLTARFTARLGRSA